ncbi:hypothetical protein IE81DRAFT_322599 [Ceraceosorus guamensis]|uniref:Glycosyltransferase 2-like domain-containing protein n=1 Tax=Ceraceosorus guamensis TaxID=1522189 RepID=A0A316W0S3_9BASI|nr:hypothetical protein IE81DRAFT_322599 [Ceraceosorus guamensis]PWN43299.1 hypothetical protein IE81DRAFT_322599 [Ceraceosorus guamensis]
MARSVPIDHSRTVVTVMDADTAFASDFFLSISAYYALAPHDKRRRTYYVPPTLFDRNGAEVPATTRIADIMWSCAGIGQIYPSSSFKAPTSAYAATMELVKHCDFWDSGPEAVGEDFHFAVKATFDTRGSVFAQTIYSPASQTNVVGSPSHSSVLSYLNDMHARWSQAVRHLWGSLDFGYAFHRALTGSFGPGQRKTGYIALMTQDSDEGAEDDDVTINGDRLKPPQYFVNNTLQVEDPQRFPSPSTTATTDSTLVESYDAMSLPRPAKKFARFDDDGDAESEDTVHKVTQTHYRTLSKYGERLDVSTAESFSRRGSDSSIVGDSEDLELGKLLASDSARAADDDDNAEVWDPPLRIRPFFAMFFRIFEAHIMIAAIFLSMQILTFYPTVVYRNGHVGFSELPGRQCTWQKCAQAIFESPFSADMPIPEGTAPGLHPAWLLPDIVMCSIRAARLLTVFGVIATIFVLLAHDYYHRAASQTRWLESEQVIRAWRERGSQGPVPARYLGTRPGQTFARKWPRGFLDFLAFPAAILYGVAPMLYAQLCHLHTNKLTYTVSGKSKSTVVIATPFVAEAEVRVSSDIRGSRASMDTARTIRQSIEIGRISVDEHGMDRYYRPERSLLKSGDRQDPLMARHKQG